MAAQHKFEVPPLFEFFLNLVRRHAFIGRLGANNVAVSYAHLLENRDTNAQVAFGHVFHFFHAFKCAVCVFIVSARTRFLLRA